MEYLHRLLNRQLKKHLGEDFNISDEMKDFLASVSDAYQNFDSDYEQLERTLEISSNELYKSNQSLNELNSDLEDRIRERTKEIEHANAILLAEKTAKEEREKKQKLTDQLLKASNDAINQLITNNNIKDSFSEIFKDVTSGK